MESQQQLLVSRTSHCAITMDKLHSYQGFSGRLHEWRDDIRARFANWRENHEGESLVDITKSFTSKSASAGGDKEDYSHIYRSGICDADLTSLILFLLGIASNKIKSISSAQHGVEQMLIEVYFLSDLESVSMNFNVLFLTMMRVDL